MTLTSVINNILLKLFLTPHKFLSYSLRIGGNLGQCCFGLFCFLLFWFTIWHLSFFTEILPTTFSIKNDLWGPIGPGNPKANYSFNLYPLTRSKWRISIITVCLGMCLSVGNSSGNSSNILQKTAVSLSPGWWISSL